MEQILMFFVGIGVTVLGYFLTRWWEGKSLKERIQKFTDFLHLHNELSAANISEQALSGLRKDIFARSTWRRRDEIEVLNKIGAALRKNIEAQKDDDPALRTQSEMNQYAYHIADLAEREMNYQVEALNQKLDIDEQKYFRKVQRAWKLFANRQAEFASLVVAGGTMQPLMRASEYRELAIERAAKLKNELRLRSVQIAVVPEM